MKRVIIIGGGASGMMAAIFAAREGARVTVIEENNKPLKKLLATGNGRCNITNHSWKGDVIRGGDVNKALELIKRFDHNKLIEFFNIAGIVTKDRDGWVYPRNDSAAVVAKTLIYEAEKAGVRIKTNQQVLNVVKNMDETFEVRTSGWKYIADRVIIAVGTGASVKEEGYRITKTIAEKYLMGFKDYLPALTSLKARNKEILRWTGVRTLGEVSLYADGEHLSTQKGELQLTDNGISGIPVFQISRYASEALSQGRDVTAVIDFLPEYGADDVKAYMDFIQTNNPDKTVKQILSGLIPERLADQIVAESFSDEDIVAAVKNYKLYISAAGDIKNSQVCMGGVSLNSLTDDLESVKVPGLFFTGEAVDVDGACGGYNLQWAFSSGRIAGEAAGKEEKHEEEEEEHSQDAEDK